jgi:hypothetical protein
VPLRLASSASDTRLGRLGSCPAAHWFICPECLSRLARVIVGAFAFTPIRLSQGWSRGRRLSHQWQFSDVLVKRYAFELWFGLLLSPACLKALCRAQPLRAVRHLTTAQTIWRCAVRWVT